MPCYNNSTEFSENNYKSAFQCTFVRDLGGLRPVNKETFGSVFLRAIPIIGIITGIGRLYSALSTRDVRDNPKSKFYHIVLGILEVLGLGIIHLILKTILSFLSLLSLFLSCCCLGCCCAIVARKISNKNN
ncbi:hypothetical protein C10C_0193 [Chlamydia serpentis]|uniref:Uncharacterized protein n=1 Tax=Chlamydia serpentis TaxID=1967782 RepID=A0A2R8FAC1_9CHLA|nr:hypothetical protein [Chlamydia serpentis]SPN73373.1 hypothetical protein C10C_0193 [Chlamydia serpentis]